MKFQALYLVFLLPILFVAVIYDTRYYRIPNWLTLSGWMLAPVLHVLVAGGAGLLSATSGLAIALAMSLPFWLCAWMGAGDVKLIAMIGGFVGSPLVFPVLLAIAVSGAVLALLALLWRGHLFQTLSRFSTTLGLTLSTRNIIYVEPNAAEREVRLPYAVAISVGTITGLFLG
jgi:prepilin peptidase CpaA